MCIFTGVVLILWGDTFLMPWNIFKRRFQVLSQLLTTTLKDAAIQGVIGAVIAFVGVALSVGVSLIVSLWIRKYNYNQLFAETVSKSRNKWLNEMRDFISTMLAEAQNPCPFTDENEQWKSKNAYYQTIVLVLRYKKQDRRFYYE